MEPIKLVTIGLPKLLEGLIVDAFQKRGSLERIGNYDNVSEYLANRNGQEPSIVIIELAASEECERVLYYYPRARLVSIENSGRAIHLWTLVPHMQILGELSPEELVVEIISNNGRLTENG